LALRFHDGDSGVGAAMRTFLAVIDGHERPLIPVEDAIGPRAVVEALREVARTGARVSTDQIKEQIV
jgi:hypothetical protein